ncbi:MAG: PEGA domain-containing protein [Candidatus Zixiibacteriota bacterium]|nr:MAG: PEGA domain-containing protein [candidate division Zixibacteria bacterium]
MADEHPPISDDEELRQSIRREIEERDRQRHEQNEKRESVRSANAEAEKRRRIYQEELRRYYQDKPGYREVIRDDGEVDWVPEAEVRHNAALFDEVLEDPDVARKKMRYVLLASAGVLAILAAVIFAFLSEGSGNIQVITNVPGAQIIIDGQPRDLLTDAVIEEEPAGEHYVTVALEGYRIQGQPVRRVDLKGGKTEVLHFNLAPAPADSIVGR